MLFKNHYNPQTTTIIEVLQVFSTFTGKHPPRPTNKELSCHII